MFQSKHLNFIDKGYHKKETRCYTFTICITQPVAKEVIKLVFTESASRPIQSSNGNVHYKDEGLKRV